MTRRGMISIAMIVIGLILMGLSYFGGAAPWCADGVACSNPEIEWSPALFVFGVMLAISSALYYEIAKGPATKESVAKDEPGEP
jgi:drug/metabolite transporter (DMT)-like permease